MRRVDHGPQVGPRTERIGSLRHGDDTRASVDELAEQLATQTARIVERQHADFGALALGQQLPRHQVGVMLHLADEDVVARPDEPFAPGIGHGVERRGGAGREDHLLLLGGPDPPGDPGAGLLVGLGGLLGEEMHAAMDVGILPTHETVDRLDHRPGLLRRGAAVQIDERPAVDLAGENRELLAYLIDVEHLSYRIFSILRDMASARASPKASMPQRRTMSPAKPSICRRRA